MFVTSEKLIFSWKRWAHIKCAGNTHPNEINPEIGVPGKGMVPGRGEQSVLCGTAAEEMR